MRNATPQPKSEKADKAQVLAWCAKVKQAKWHSVAVQLRQEELAR